MSGWGTFFVWLMAYFAATDAFRAHYYVAGLEACLAFFYWRVASE